MVIPNIRDRFTQNAQDLAGAVGKSVKPRRDIQTGILLNGKATFANRKRIGKPNFVLPWQLGEYGTQLTADDAFFLPANEEHPSGYLVKGVEMPRDLAKKPSLALDDKPVILTPHDYKWLEKDQCFVVSGVTFEHVAAADDWRRYASIVELVNGLHNPSLNFGPDVRVSVHARIVQPMLDVTLLFLGLPLILSRSSRNVFIAIGLCVVVVVVFYLLVLGCQYLGSSSMVSPALAAWLPLLILVPAAMAMSEPLRE
jgi:lipopolysaccharide export system permease protein